MEAKPLDEARAALKSQDFDRAIELYTQHLRTAPQDADVWNELAAANYHAGLPRRALRYLKKVEARTRAVSYNAYYQGLCLQELANGGTDGVAQAEVQFRKAAEHVDEYGSRALFELGASAYNQRQKQSATLLLQTYQQHYPRGVYAALVAQMLESLRNDNWLPSPVRGRDRLDSEKALYRYNALSFSNRPHFWMGQLGGTTIMLNAKDPKESGGLTARNETNQGLILNLALGAGPFSTPTTTSWAGYTYRQLWLTDNDRLNTFADDPGDIAYEPFQLDLLRREHSFFGDFRKNINDSLITGVYGKLGFARIGSQLSFRPEDQDGLDRVLPVRDTQLIIPWFGASYANNFRTLLYLYFRKQIDSDAPENSHKTFELGGSGTPQLSFGLTHAMSFPSIQFDMELHAFQYKLTFNDMWLDYMRRGAILSTEAQFLPGLYVDLTGGFYKDVYDLPIIRTHSCKTVVDNSGAETSGEKGLPEKCPRDDSGWMAELEIYWNYTQFHRISFKYLLVQNTNADLQEFDSVRQEFTLVFSMAFPSVKRVSRFVDRFADSAFTKEIE